MSPSKVSHPPVSMIFSVLILIITPNKIAARSNPSLIKFACAGDESYYDTKSCLHLLQTTPEIAAARDLFNLSIAIIDAGISNASATLRHMEKTGVNSTAMENCKVNYDEVVSRFTLALTEVKRLEFLAPTYYLLTLSTDCIQWCRSALAKGKVQDAVISRGNVVAQIFGLSAFTVVAELEDRSKHPPPTHRH